ncbi:MAG TPA: hypothetical protein VGQ64_03940 [Candidatus Limnocylindrales bacterium]|jgi:hypothetical protein|nr:hypothetical protein [Candidatus Limnocylindrales bacterium]
MESHKMFLMTYQLAELHAEAAANRLAKQARNSRVERPGRIAVALAAFRSLPARTETKMELPKLTDYPYRS